MIKRSAGLLGVLLLAQMARTPLHAQERRWTVDDVLAMKSIAALAISPDGEWIAYVVSHRDLQNSKNLSNIWLVPRAGGESFQLTHGDGTERSPAWAPDGSDAAAVAFLRRSTGQDFGTDAKAWGQWLRRNRWVYAAASDDPRITGGHD